MMMIVIVSIYSTIHIVVINCPFDYNPSGWLLMMMMLLLVYTHLAGWRIAFPLILPPTITNIAVNATNIPSLTWGVFAYRCGLEYGIDLLITHKGCIPLMVVTTTVTMMIHTLTAICGDEDIIVDITIAAAIGTWATPCQWWGCRPSPHGAGGRRCAVGGTWRRRRYLRN